MSDDEECDEPAYTCTMVLQLQQLKNDRSCRLISDHSLHGYHLPTRLRATGWWTLPRAGLAVQGSMASSSSSGGDTAEEERVRAVGVGIGNFGCCL